MSLGTSGNNRIRIFRWIRLCEETDSPRQKENTTDLGQSYFVSKPLIYKMCTYKTQSVYFVTATDEKKSAYAHLHTIKEGVNDDGQEVEDEKAKEEEE